MIHNSERVREREMSIDSLKLPGTQLKREKNVEGLPEIALSLRFSGGETPYNSSPFPPLNALVK